MSPAVWIGLGFLLLAVVAGAIFLFLRVREFMRVFRVFGPEFDSVMDSVDRSTRQLERNSAKLESSMPRLEASIERLRISLAQLAVLRAAVQDVQDSVGRLAWIYPRK